MPSNVVRRYMAPMVYLATCLATLTYILVADNGFALGGAFFVVLALPWTLVLLVLIDLSSVSVGPVNVAFLFAGVAANTFLLASLSRNRAQHALNRAKRERREPPAS